MEQYNISKVLLDKLSSHISLGMGLYFSQQRYNDLLRGIRGAAKELEHEDIEKFIAWLTESPLSKELVEVLARHLTIGETYFMRETKVIEALESHILPEIITLKRNNNKKIRVWSAGCCTGEEAYSVSILLNRLIPDIDSWDIKIIGTDINPFFLQKAIKGEYTEWSFRNIPLWIKETFFQKSEKNTYLVIPKIRKNVRFSYLNLAEEQYGNIVPGINQIDIILCRNVLMYFDPVRIKEIADLFYNLLVQEGWLIVGSSETSQAFFSRYKTVNYPGAILYRRSKKEENRPVKYSFSTIQSTVKKTPVTRNKTTIKSVSTEKQKKSNKKENIETIIDYYNQGNYIKVVNEAEMEFKIQKTDTQLLLIAAKSYANLGRLNDALDCCDTAITLDKLNPHCYHIQAEILHEQDRHEEAARCLKRVLYLDPDYLIAHFMLGNLARQSGKIKESNKYYKNTIDLLEKYDKESLLPDTEGITAGGLMECIRIMKDGKQ
jgi:chemotaxis protein methyltransferase CheR